MHPDNLLSDNGMEEQAEKFLYASGKLQVLAYKHELETNLRTKNIRFDVEGESFPQKPISIPESCSAVFPVNIRVNEVLIQYSTAQLVSRHIDSINGNTQIYLMQIDGIPSEIKDTNTATCHC